MNLSVASLFHTGLPRISGGSASMISLSGPAQASLALRPVGLLNRPRRPLSRGFDPVGRPTKPLVSYQSNRQLPGWNLPPLVKRAIGAHCLSQHFRVFRRLLRFILALVLKPSVRQLDCPIVIEREAGIPGDFPQVPVGVPEVTRIPAPECLKSGPHNLSSTGHGLSKHGVDIPF